jgi:hypothetical protein
MPRRKKHLTQQPQNKAKLRAMHRKSTQTKNSNHAQTIVEEPTVDMDVKVPNTDFYILPLPATVASYLEECDAMLHTIQIRILNIKKLLGVS